MPDEKMGGGGRGNADGRRDLLFGRLIALMVAANESAQIAYPRRLHMPDINRQIIFMLGLFGSATSKDLIVASGREGAQISRGVKALSEARLITRTTVRGAFGLNANGQAAMAEIVRIVGDRNAALCEGIAASEISHFLAMTAELTARASSILKMEEQNLPAGMPVEPAAIAVGTPGDPAARAFVLPALQSLTNYLRRSGDNLFLRELGMSFFEWRVLSEIEASQPIGSARLLALLARDKSQVARTIKTLERAGLIVRIDAARTNFLLELTEAGRASYDRLAAISAQRDAYLFADHAPQDRDFYLAMLARLTENAQTMLDSEQAAISVEDPQPVAQTGAARSAASTEQTDLEALQRENAELKRMLEQAALENARLRRAMPLAADS